MYYLTFWKSNKLRKLKSQIKKIFGKSVIIVNKSKINNFFSKIHICMIPPLMQFKIEVFPALSRPTISKIILLKIISLLNTYFLISMSVLIY